MSRLAEKLGSGKPVLTASCLPPRDLNPAKMKNLAGLFPVELDGILVADGTEVAQGSALACAALLAAEQREPILSLVTRDRNRVALEADLLGSTALGVRNFHCISGTHQALGASVQAAGAYDIDSTQLSQAVVRMAQGMDFAGGKIDGVPALTVLAAAHPYLRPMELSILQLKKKIAAGAHAVLTDAIVDMAGFEEWMKAVRAVGLEKKIAIIASVKPETAEIASKIKGLPGVRGIHILSAGQENRVAQIIKEARLA